MFSIIIPFHIHLLDTSSLIRFIKEQIIWSTQLYKFVSFYQRYVSLWACIYNDIPFNSKYDNEILHLYILDK